MKKVLISFLIIQLLFVGTVAHAATIIDDAMGNLRAIANSDGIGISITTNPDQDIAIVIGGIIQVVLGVLGIVFLGLTVYGGWLWMTAAGNQERVGRAKDLLRDSVIGLAVIIGAFALTRFVIERIVEASSVAPAA